MTIELGTSLGPYRVQSLLGAGGMGEVYRALDVRLDRDVAIKVLAQSFALDSNYQQRLEREAKAIASLQHPGVCALFDIGLEGETPYWVMEYLEGKTLAQQLREGPLPVERALEIARAIA